MSEQLITNAELAAFLPEFDTSAYSATTISGMIQMASDAVRNFCGVDGFLRSTVTGEQGRININPDGELNISVRRPKLRQGELISMDYKSIGQRQSMILQQDSEDLYYVDASGFFFTYPDSYRVNFGSGLLGMPTSQLMYEISYVGGYADSIETLPYDLKQACILFMRDTLGQASNPAGALSFRQGSYSETRGGNSGDTSNDSMYVAQAKRMLREGDYVRMVVG